MSATIPTTTNYHRSTRCDNRLYIHGETADNNVNSATTDSILAMSRETILSHNYKLLNTNLSIQYSQDKIASWFAASLRYATYSINVLHRYANAHNYVTVRTIAIKCDKMTHYDPLLALSTLEIYFLNPRWRTTVI